MKSSNEELKELVTEFFQILDTVETSDSGREFNPVYISSCRIMKTQRLGEILPRMKELAKS